MSDTPGGGPDFTNAGESGDEETDPTSTNAEFGNAGLGPEPTGPTALQAEWSNAGLAKNETDPTDLHPDWSNAGLQFTPPTSTSLIAPPSQAGIRYTSNIAINVFFTVTVDTVDLGAWSKCSGLGMTIAYDERNESNTSFIQHHLPGHLTYEKITLERPLTRDCQSVLSWFSAYHLLPISTSGQITCMDQGGDVVMTWELTGVTPHSWRGPTLDATAGTAVAVTEQLIIQHQGFL